MESQFRKRLYFCCGIVLALLIGCVGMQPKQDEQIAKLEKRIDSLEILMGAGVGASFYPARDCDWEATGAAAGDCDYITSVANQDVMIVGILDETIFGPTLKLFLPYIVDSDYGSGDNKPWKMKSGDAGDTNEALVLMDSMFNRVFGKMYIYNVSSTTTVESYHSGAHFINSANSARTFNLPADGTDLVYCFGNGHVSGTPINQALTLDPNGTDVFILDGDACTAGYTIVSTGDGKDNICIIGLDSTYWKVTGYIGSWACGS